MQLGIPGTFELASVLRRPFDGPWRFATRHIVVLHETPDKKLVTIDPSTLVGYGYGTISEECETSNGKLRNAEKRVIYEDVVRLNKTEEELISRINILRNRFYMSNERGNELLDVTSKLLSQNHGTHLNSWLSEVAYIDAIVRQENHDYHGFSTSISQAVELDPLKIKVLRNSETPKDIYRKVRSTLDQFQEQTQKMVQIWSDKVRDIFSGGDMQKYPQGIQYLQWINSELYHSGLLTESIPTINLSGVEVPLWEISPRVIHDLGLSVAWIKPTSYSIGVSAAASEAIRKAGKSLWKTKFNPTRSNSKLLGFTPLLASHPYANVPNNFKSYNGDMDVILVDQRPAQLGKIKKEFRREWGRNLKAKPNTTVPWVDGDTLEWSPFLTNYIHSTDFAAETVVYLLLEYPQLSLISRWDYPHPNL